MPYKPFNFNNQSYLLKYRDKYKNFRIFHRTLTHQTAILHFCDKTKNNNDNFESITKNLYAHPGIGHRVLVIQPRIKYGPGSEKKTRSEIKLEEAVSLINTLSDWTVVKKFVMPVAHIDSSLLFGKGNLVTLKEILQNNPSITSIFIAIDILTALQNTELEKYFKVRVFDRYQIILQIFHNHAHTNEAKLQLSLAEIPYLRIKLASYSHTFDARTFQEIHHVGGDGETFIQTRRWILNNRELKLKKELEKIKAQREFLRKSENRSSFPVVAVVGYTNCGKTTLIKSLTDDSRLQPKNKLFATLDVTLHPGLLPSNQKVLFVDTVGFISDVPTQLIQSFRSTLEEINIADLVIHVRDISHPDTEAQKETVLKTLQELNLPPKLLESILEVRNKIDLLKDPENVKECDTVQISATEGTGLSDLLDAIEEKLFQNTGHLVSLLRIPNGGPEYSWLLREAAIRDAMADTIDANYLIVEVVITSGNLAKFKHTFGDLSISPESIVQ
ncbi:putative GTP-binding protein 6 [Trichonephila clavata]|uniref:Putative GTP-binding protein 6 n=1 Tax=Trichonephila clavata TaxID=2740835 RepID=A0A8X6FEW8_TRICU|nr:putative GTP-binding protein 6 [Trichonephila clavata]